MDILYTLIPLSVVLVLLIIGVLAWAVQAGQFDHLDGEAQRVVDDDDAVACGALRPDAPRPEAPRRDSPHGP